MALAWLGWLGLMHTTAARSPLETALTLEWAVPLRKRAVASVWLGRGNLFDAGCGRFCSRRSMGSLLVSTPGGMDPASSW